MDWQEEFKKRLVSAEEAIRVVKSGDRVVFAQGMEPSSLGLALAARKDELKNVSISVRTPGRDFGWYDPGWEDSFAIDIGFPLPIVREMVDEKRCDLGIGSLGFIFHEAERRKADIVLVEVSPPDSHGYCSFGASRWAKLEEIRSARIALAEINSNLIRTYGDNAVHVSEIDFFVEHESSGRTPGATDLLGRKSREPSDAEKTIAGYVSTLIKDGDTIQIGVGSTSEWCAVLDTFDNKHDLGWHSETTPKGIIRHIREGIFTGKHKTLHQGKAVATACGGGSKEDMDFVNMNPLFELYSAEHILDIKVISANDNMVAINSAVSVDLTGQTSAESIGTRIVSAAGGQTAFAIGSWLSKGGRNITVLTSTTSDGKTSRIVPELFAGTIITLPRILTDLVVTEYGIARLRGKTQRERVGELISIAHPDFRKELKRQAEMLYWPDTKQATRI